MNKMSQIKYSDARQHIMVVDDEFHVGLFVEVLLSNKGYEVTRYINSKEALSSFAEQPWLFDLIITDQNMPNMSGTELAKNLLTIRPDIPIILCTGFGSEDIEEFTKGIGISAYVSKPLETNELLRQIDDNLSGK